MPLRRTGIRANMLLLLFVLRISGRLTATAVYEFIRHVGNEIYFKLPSDSKTEVKNEEAIVEHSAVPCNGCGICAFKHIFRVCRHFRSHSLRLRQQRLRRRHRTRQNGRMDRH